LKVVRVSSPTVVYQESVAGSSPSCATAGANAAGDATPIVAESVVGDVAAGALVAPGGDSGAAVARSPDDSGTATPTPTARAAPKAAAKKGNKNASLNKVFNAARTVKTTYGEVWMHAHRLLAAIQATGTNVKEGESDGHSGAVDISWAQFNNEAMLKPLKMAMEDCETFIASDTYFCDFMSQDANVVKKDMVTKLKEAGAEVKLQEFVDGLGAHHGNITREANVLFKMRAGQQAAISASDEPAAKTKSGKRKGTAKAKSKATSKAKAKPRASGA
jgi:hypothetical protein